MRAKILIIIGSFSVFCAFIALGELAVVFNILILSITLPIIIFLIRERKIKIVLACVLAVLTGIFCGLLIKHETGKKFYPQKCETVIVASDPSGGEFLAKNDHLKVIIKSNSDLSYGDRIEACEFKAAELKDELKKYYFNQYRSDQVFYAYNVKLVASSTSWLKSLYSFKKVSTRHLMSYFDRDNFALAVGLLVGGSEFFSKEMKANFKNSGTSHIVAISGYNITIILIVIFLNLRRLASRNVAGIITIFAIFAFAELTGMSASVTRASIMGIVYILLKFIGRPSNPLLILFGVCAIMIVFDPYITFDIGFQLSALATAGISLFADKIGALFDKIHTPKILSENISATLSAQLLTIPVLVSLGKISLISPIANVLILPTIPLAMFMVFMTLIGSFINYYFGFFISIFCAKILEYINFIIRLFGGDKFAFVPVNKVLISSLWLVIFCIIFYFLYRSNEKTKNPKSS